MLQVVAHATIEGEWVKKKKFLSKVSKKDGWCYIFIEKDGQLGIHELYTSRAAKTIMWTECPVGITCTKKSALRDIEKMLRDKLFFSEDELKEFNNELGSR